MISLLRSELAEWVSRTELPRKVRSEDFSVRIKSFPTHTCIAGADTYFTWLDLMTCKSMRANQRGVLCTRERIGHKRVTGVEAVCPP